IIALFILAQTAFAMRTSGDWMMGWRYMISVGPLWTIAIMASVIEPYDQMMRSGKQNLAKGVIYGAIGIFIAVCLLAARDFNDQENGSVSWAKLGYSTTSRGILKGYLMENAMIAADFVNRVVPSGSSIAFSEMGALPYFTPQIKWLDTCGLTDAEIAHLTGVSRFRTGITGDFKDISTGIGAHIATRKPDYIMQWLEQGFSPPSVLGGQYVAFAKTRITDFGGKEATYLFLWKRRNLN
ncbi:MAG: hypothetical protein ABJA67_13625, partial [Chthonomonadales bacterium]